MPLTSLNQCVRLAGIVLLAVLPCSCQTPPRSAAPAAAGTLADALSAAQNTVRFNTAEEQEANTAATGRTALLGFARTGGSQTPVTVRGAGRTWTLTASWPENRLFDELYASPPTNGREEAVVTRGGVGAPVIARWRHTPDRKLKNPFLHDGGCVTIVTVTLEFNGTRATLRLHDPRIEVSVVLAGRRRPLGGDFQGFAQWIDIELKGNKHFGCRVSGGAGQKSNR